MGKDTPGIRKRLLLVGTPGQTSFVDTIVLAVVATTVCLALTVDCKPILIHLLFLQPSVLILPETTAVFFSALLKYQDVPSFCTFPATPSRIIATMSVSPQADPSSHTSNVSVAFEKDNNSCTTQER